MVAQGVSAKTFNGARFAHLNVKYKETVGVAKVKIAPSSKSKILNNIHN
jgi:hypothetical protein